MSTRLILLALLLPGCDGTPLPDAGTIDARLVAVSSTGDLQLIAALPVDTDPPDDTDGPGDTDQPGDTDLPGDTDEPGDTDVPEDTDEPGDTDPPSGAIDGLYFGELELVAYDYRPGEVLQTGGFASGFGNADWSHYVVVQSGHPEARDVLLRPGEPVDFDALNADYGRDVDPAWAAQVGVFEVDLFEVNMMRNGVLRQGAYLGMNAEGNGLDTHPLHRYPDVSSVPDTYADTRFAGFTRPEQTTNVIFARDDWFPQPVLVELSPIQDGPDGPRYEVSWSSTTLTPQQDDVLVSMAEGGTARRFYSNLVVVPFAGPIAVDLGRGAPLRVQVGFDLSDAIDTDATDFDAIFEPDQTGTLHFRSDDQGVPFGLQISFDQP